MTRKILALAIIFVGLQVNAYADKGHFPIIPVQLTEDSQEEVLIHGTELKADNEEKFSKYEIEGGYFSCLVPSNWELKRDKESDEEYKIYEIELVGPGRTWIYVSYYAKDNEDFKSYIDYIDRNTKDGLGRKNSDIGKYSDAMPFKLGKIKGFEIINELKEYVSLTSKSSDAYWVKKRIIVIPAKEGFFSLSYSAQKPDFEKYHPIFKKILSTFVPRK